MNTKNESLVMLFIAELIIIPFIFIINYIFCNYIFHCSQFQSIFSFILCFISLFIFLIFFYISLFNKTKIQIYILFLLLYIILSGILFIFFFEKKFIFIFIFYYLIEFITLYFVSSLIKLHNNFISIIDGKQGKQLKELLYQNKFISIDLDSKIKFIKKFFFIFGIIYFIIIFFSAKIFSYQGTFFILMTIIFFIAQIFLYYKLSFFKKESFYLNMGLRIKNQNIKKLLKSIFTIILVSFLTAFFISKDSPFIKFSINFENENKVQITTTPIYEPTYFDDIPSFIPEINEIKEDDKTSKLFYQILGIIIKLIGFAFLAGVLLFSIYFLFKPLFSKEFILFWKNKVLIKNLINMKNEILLLLKNIFKNQKNENFQIISVQDFNDCVEQIINCSHKNKEKLKELDKLTKQFVKVINFGTKNKVFYKKNLAPVEYMNLIKHLIKEKVFITEEEKLILLKYCDLIGLIFEKALYDIQLISYEEETEFINSIKNLIKIKIGN